MNDSYLYVIIALLPLSASMVVGQANPYHALVIRGILGAIAALVYAVLGAADVALTEALVGTMLAITLYAVAVRSSMVMRLGVLESAIAPKTHPSLRDSLSTVNRQSSANYQSSIDPSLTSLLADLRTFLNQHYLRLELAPYATVHALEQALREKEVHAICVERSPLPTLHPNADNASAQQPPYETTVRIQRLYDLMNNELTSSLTSLIYVSVSADRAIASSATTTREVQL